MTLFSNPGLAHLLQKLALALAVATSGTAAFAQRTVPTDKGEVSGIVMPAYRAFLGIPYAAPPVGDLRWKPPQPHAHWGRRQATSIGARCPQLEGSRIASADEDCLVLNVYTPRVARRLPVMVFIHGGSFMVGAGSDYDPTILARKANAVVVTFNYRLGALGLLAHPALSAEAPDQASGLYALQDQQFALQWVGRNIDGFGGDRRNITVFGESAGGISICAHLASPTAAGLFHKAIIESGPCTADPIPLATAERAGREYAEKLNCSAAACLRAQTVEALLLNPPTETSGAGKMWLPAFGGKSSSLPLTPMDALRAGKFNRVPVMNGANHDEFRYFTALEETAQGYALSAQQYLDTVQGTFGSRAPAVLAEYPLASFSAPDVANSILLGDALFNCGTRGANLLLAGRNVPVYAYEFNDPAAPAPIKSPYMPLLAAHSTELPYIFQTAKTQMTRHQQQLSDQMIRYWANFAASGNPNGPGMPAWPAYTISRERFQQLAPGAVTSIDSYVARHKCEFWVSQGY
jgi:para-nitrobenzyl esterase